MNESKLFSALLTLCVLLNSNLFSQPNSSNIEKEKQLVTPFYSSNEMVNWNNGIHRQHLDRVQKTIIFDSSSVVDSLIGTKANGIKEKRTYIYNSNINWASILTERWNGSQWVNYEQLTYTYDSNGNMTLRLKEIWIGGQWVNNYRDTYTYNSYGNMIS
ncbi:hypothetical protein ACFLSX_00920 [Calditrichota bacterium]